MAKSDKIEYGKRVATVQEYILRDYSSTQIIAHCVASYRVSERQAKRYIQDAYAGFEAITAADKKQRLNFHVQKRMKLLREIDPAEKNSAFGVRTVLEVMKDIAKLEGLYVEKHEHTGKDGRPIEMSVTKLKPIIPGEEDNGSGS